jgi:hypothetical protein
MSMKQHLAKAVAERCGYVVGVVFAAGLLSVVLAGHASAEQPSNWETISGPGGIARVIMGQQGPLDFNGFVSLQGCDGGAYWNCNDWVRSTVNYIGPGSRKYHTYQNVRNGECLANVVGVVVTQPCVWADTSQWWSAQSVVVTVPCTGPCLPQSNTHWLLSPWNQPNDVATIQSKLLMLTPRVGTLGSPAQRLDIGHLSPPPVIK